MRTIFICLCGQESVCRISRNDTTAERHITQNAMHVERIPEGGMNDVPDVPQEPALLIDSGRRHHEADPRVGQKHEQCTNNVQDHGHAQVNPLEETLRHLVPAVVIDVQSSALRYEHQCIDMHDWTEDTGQVAKKRWIERQEGENQNTTKNCGQ